jgi:hypothetical protein
MLRSIKNKWACHLCAAIFCLVIVAPLTFNYLSSFLLTVCR